MFLGAGASAFALQPTTTGLLKLLRSRVQQRKNDPNRNDILQAHVEHIVNSKMYNDVESLYDGIQTMIDTHDNRNCGPITERIQHHDNEDQYTLTHEQVSNELKELQFTIRETLLDSFKIKPKIPELIVEMYDAIRYVMENNEIGEFWVFTTNYDLVMEAYAKKKNLEVVNGFGPPDDMIKEWTGTWKPNTDKPPLYLAKLHGSIRWYRDVGVITEAGVTARRNVEDDIMIAPTEGAKRYDGEPFSTLMDCFRNVVQDTNILLVIGFSYRDEEIVRIIKNRLAEGMTLISISEGATDDIHRVAGKDVEIREINASTGLNVVVDSRIILCKQSLASDTIADVTTALEDAYELFQQQKENNAAPPPQDLETDEQI